MTQRFASVILATRNRAALLADTLEAIDRQRWPRDRLEVVVADNNSSDDTRARVETAAAREGAPIIRYLHVVEPGKSFAVNAALAQASGDLLVFTDDDVRPEPDWIERLAAAFERTGADFVAGRILPRWESEPPRWLSPSLYGVLAVPENGTASRPIDSSHSAIIPIGANMAVRRHVVDRIGGLRTDLGKLDGTLRTGEDHEFFLRMLQAGFRGAYEPSAVVRHWVPSARLTRDYFERWLRQNGHDVARLDASYAPNVRRWLGVPRYLWRQAAVDLVEMVRMLGRRDDPDRTARQLRLVWFGGYLEEAWSGPRRLLGTIELAVGR